MHWLTVAFILFLPEVHDLEVHDILQTKELPEVIDCVSFTKALEMSREPDERSFAVLKRVVLGRPRYTAVPFESRDALLSYLAERSLTSGTVLDVRKGLWYNVDADYQYRLVPVGKDRKGR